MAQSTGIEWTDTTWNPLAGCTWASSGCDRCYAAVMARRLEAMANADIEAGKDPGRKVKYIGITNKNKAGRVMFNGKVNLDPFALNEPFTWASPHRVFVNSMSDLFHKEVPDEFIDRVYAVMAETSQHIYQVLTKRPERMASYCNDPMTPHRIAKAIDRLRSHRTRLLVEEDIRPIPDCPGYFVSNFGHVYTSVGSANCVQCGKELDGDPRKRFCGQSCKDRDFYDRKHRGKSAGQAKGKLHRMSPDMGEQGHHRVTLTRGGVRIREMVHRLVLSVFVRSPEEGEQACHRDGDPSNNFVDNLRWGTQSDNWEDRRRHGQFRAHHKLMNHDVVAIRSSELPSDELADLYSVSETQIRNIRSGCQWAVEAPIPWPLSNCWAGTSVENQEYADKRIPHLLRIPAAVRFLSLEPLLGPVQLPWCEWCGSWGDHDCYDANDDSPAIHWSIIGGESGAGARPMDVEWVRDLVRQCQDAGCAPFVKQLGSVWARDKFIAGKSVFQWGDTKGHDMQYWPKELRIREFPRVEVRG